LTKSNYAKLIFNFSGGYSISGQHTVWKISSLNNYLLATQLKLYLIQHKQNN